MDLTALPADWATGHFGLRTPMASLSHLGYPRR